MSELTIKQMIDVALEKDINPPDEATGLVLYESSGTISNSEFTGKGAKASTDPSDEELEVINSFALAPQEKSNWTILRNIDPVGDPNLADSHSDVFAAAAMKDMASQAVGTPILYDHSHSLDGTPPLGHVISAKLSKGRLKETWALPKEDYNASMVKGIMNGTVNKISIGAFIDPKDKVCNSCTDNRSIYSMDCPHIPGRLDPKSGEVTTVTIRRVKRYVERSLVNIPARLGTGLKSLAPEQGENKVFASAGDGVPLYRTIEAEDLPLSGTVTGSTGDLAPLFTTSTEKGPDKIVAQLTKKLEANDTFKIFDLPLDYENVFLQILIPEGKDVSGASPLGIQNFITNNPKKVFKFDIPSYVQQVKVGEAFVPQIKIDNSLFPDNESVNKGNFVLSIYVSRKELAPASEEGSVATISPVINEDSIVAEKDVKAPEAQEPSEKEEIIAPEATVAEEKTEAPEPQEVTIEVPVVKSLEVEELTKSFNGAIEVKTEELNKTLSSLTEKLAKQQEFSEKQGEALKSLSDSVAALAENVAKLASLSTEEAVEKLLEVAGQIKEQTSAPKPEEPMTKFSFIDSLRK